MLIEGVSQDPLENYFGRERSMDWRRDNSNLRTFRYQDNAICNYPLGQTRENQKYFSSL